MLDTQLKSDIKKLWDKFWSGGISNPIVAIEQITYLFFIKKISDMDRVKIENSNIDKEEYKSIFKNNENCKWDKLKLEDNLISHFQNVVFPFLQNLTTKDIVGKEIEKQENDISFLEGIQFEIKEISLLKESIGIVDKILISNQNHDTKGDIYEFLLSELKTAGKNGQFRTPRHIIEMIVRILDPKKNDTILDPSCGTAGFLVEAYNYILKTNPSFEELEKTRKNFYGYELDSTMIRISYMNLLMHGISTPNLRQVNSLSKNIDLISFEEKFDIILSNPPFK
jgi:type I restriction enzyme M protein